MTYYLTSREIKTYVLIDEQNVFDQPVRSETVKTYDNIKKIGTGQGDDYKNGCLLDYEYFKKYCRNIATDWNKQQALDADPNALPQINFTGRSKRNSFRFFRRNCKSILILFLLQYKMMQYNTLKVKLSNLQLNKSKSELKDGTKVTLKI